MQPMDPFPGIPPIEPAANIRQLAAELRQFTVALVEQGYPEPAAVHLTGVWLTALIARGGAQ